MSAGIYAGIRTWCKAGKNRSLVIGGVGIFLTVGVILLIMDFVNSRTEFTEGFIRNSYGKGARTEQLQVVTKDKERSNIEIEVSERAYSDEEVKSMFQRSIAHIEKQILGSNENLDYVETDLNLITSIPNVPVEISWELDRYDVMNIYGEIQMSQLTEEGTLIHLTATLTYTENEKKQARYECTAVLFPKTLKEEERFIKSIKEAIKKEDKNTQLDQKLTLPQKIEGSKVAYFPIMKERGIVVVVMAVMIGILLFALEKQNQEQEAARKKAQMQLDYPEIISKLTLFIGAGMTVKRAWKKVVADYEEHKAVWGIRYAYEEMYRTGNEMDSGVTEAESYEHFGKRCGLQEYIKLGALLSQNLRRGTKSLNQILRTEAVQSFEERKARAKRLGEEAGTKLLAPMFLMLSVVLVIVIVPAFMSVQM